MDKEDDGDDDDKAVAISRYPVMPSLASLRMMRNRLHLAYLGKKLMKWTAISTGRELRKIAGLLVSTQTDVLVEMREAYIMLARCRYFYPALNLRVVENCSPEANITVGTAVKLGAGVKITKFIIREAGIDGYEHLGIEKGGQCIKDAKEIWARLLKKTILMLQYRIGFEQVDVSHKNATKRVNVLQRVHIPRICMTVKYILTELDEQEREEMFRLKRFKEAKKAKAVKPEMEYDDTDIVKTQDKLIKIVIPETKYDVKPEVKPPEVKPPEVKPPQVKPPEVKPPEVKPPELVPVCSEPKEVKVKVKPIQIKDTPKIPPIKKKDPVIKLTPKKKPCKECIPCLKDVEKSESDKKMELLKKHLRDIIGLSREFLEKGFKNVDVKEFVSTCKEAQQRIDQFVDDQDPPSQVDNDLKDRLEHLKSHLREVIDVTREFCDEPSSPTCLKTHELQPCPNDQEEISTCCLQETTPKPCSGSAEGRMAGLKNHIEGIVKLTEDYKKDGLLSASVEAFLTSCEHVKSKINTYAKEIDEARRQRLDLLSKRVTFVEELANFIDQEEMEDFLCSCKDFKDKLDECKGKGYQPPTEGDLAKLFRQIDNIEEFDNEQNSQFESVNTEKYVKACDSITTHTDSKFKKAIKEQPQCLRELRLNIDDIMKLVSKCRAEGSISESADAFMKSCENAKAKIDVYGKPSQVDDNGSTCCSDLETASEEILFGKCEGGIRMEPSNKRTQPHSCNYCDDLFGDEQPEKVIRNTCLQDPFNEVDWLPNVSAKPSAQNTCELCKKSNEKAKEKGSKEPKDRLSGGYFKIVTKIKRIQNIDGSVREERKTITIRDDRNDHVASMVADDPDDHDPNYSNDEACVFNNKRKVNTCVTPSLNRRGFTRFLKKVISEKITNNPPMTKPCSRQCMSLENLIFDNRIKSPSSFTINPSDFLMDLKDSSSISSETFEKPCSSKKDDQ